MPAPPPPPVPSFSVPAPNTKDQGRNLLLQSIRNGKSLRKTVTVDKSGPAVSGKVVGDTSHSTLSNASTNNTSSSLNNNVSNSLNNGNPPPLGGLFSGGMPKLKPTGLRTNMAERDSNNITNNFNTGNTTSNVIASTKRGPPPLPPPAAQKPQVFSQITNVAETTASNAETSREFGKPNLAPKPPPPPPLSTVPQKPSPPPKKMNLTIGNTVSRAQSMRLARSSPTLASPLSSLHQSQDRLNEAPQPKTLNRTLRHPVVRPPSPPKQPSSINTAIPTTGSTTTTTRAAPPPPSRVSAPSIPPPPPPLPSRSAPMQPRISSAPSLPPTPPTRNTCARNGQLPPQLPPIDLEVRFAEMFHSIAYFPPPEPFRRVPKVYNSRNVAKQQAPAPPLRTTSDTGAMH